MIRQLLVLLECISAHVAIIFTTTNEGHEALFEHYDDASPLLSRCLRLDLGRRDLARTFAVPAKLIAEREGLDGQSLERYVKLAQTHRTLLASEKLLSHRYYDGGSPGDHGGIYGALDYDVARDIRQSPKWDAREDSGENYIFGSAHRVSLNAAMCDGSVRVVDYSVSARVWEAMGTKAGGKSAP